MNLAILGIDLAKHTFDVGLITRPGHRRQHVCAHTQLGIARLCRWLHQSGVRQAHVCLDATGTYGEALAAYLHAHGHVVRIVTPAAIKAFAASRRSRTTTDRVDAAVIAQVCRVQQPPRWAPLTEEVRELPAVVRRLEGLTEMRGMAHNRRGAGSPSAPVTASISALLAYFDAEIGHIEQCIQQHINQDPQLHHQHRRLQSIPGIGAATAALFLAEVDVHQYANARQAAAFAGLVPRIRPSGSSGRGRTRLSNVGSPRLRRALDFPAVTALRWRPGLRQWAAGLRERGKCLMQRMGAAMRKLVHIMYGVLMSGHPFDPALAQGLDKQHRTDVSQCQAGGTLRCTHCACAKVWHVDWRPAQPRFTRVCFRAGRRATAPSNPRGSALTATTVVFRTHQTSRRAIPAPRGERP